MKVVCDDGVTMIITYLLLSRQWMFVQLLNRNSVEIRSRLAGSRDLKLSDNDIRDFAKCQLTRICKINLSPVRHLSTSNFSLLVRYRNIQVYSYYIEDHAGLCEWRCLEGVGKLTNGGQCKMYQAADTSPHIDEQCHNGTSNYTNKNQYYYNSTP